MSIVVIHKHTWSFNPPLRSFRRNANYRIRRELANKQVVVFGHSRAGGKRNAFLKQLNIKVAVSKPNIVDFAVTLKISRTCSVRDIGATIPVHRNAVDADKRNALALISDNII